MKRPPSSDLPDVNVWLALSDTRHAQHAAARQYWKKQRATQVVFCRVSTNGILAVGSGTIDLAGTLIYTGAATSSDRGINLPDSGSYTMQNNGSGLLTLNGGVTAPNGGSVVFRGAQSISETGLVAIGIGGVTHTDATSTLTLSNAGNSFSGAVSAAAGTISVNSVSSIAVPAPCWSSPSNPQPLLSSGLLGPVRVLAAE